MNCPNCGASNAEDTKFCVVCGSRLETVAPPPPPPPTYQQPPQQGYQQPQQGFQQPYQPVPPVYSPMGDPNREPLKTSQFFWMDLVISIPIVGLILLFVWGFGSNVNENRKNWCKAKLIWMLVGIVLGIVAVIVVAALGLTLGDSLAYYF